MNNTAQMSFDFGSTNSLTSIFGDVIYAYTRRQAIEDGVQVDANDPQSDLASVTKQHFKFPCYITGGLFAVMQQAVENPRYCQDYAGIWHDICWMAKQAMRRNSGATLDFQVIIQGAGRSKYHTITVECGPTDIDDERPCLTFRLPEED